MSVHVHLEAGGGGGGGGDEKGNRKERGGGRKETQLTLFRHKYLGLQRSLAT